MARQLTHGDFVKTPSVRLSAKPGGKFIGVLKSSKPSKFGRIYTFAIEDSDAPIVIKNDAGELTDVDVKPGDDVAVFASGQLNDALSQAKEEERVGIKFVEKKLNPRTGRYFNDYNAAVLDEGEKWD